MIETNARTLRAAGWRVLFRSGRVIVGRTVGAYTCGSFHGADRGPRATSVDRGEWMTRPAHEWSAPLPWEELELERVAPWCYCSSLPGTGCDFCNGTRPIPNPEHLPVRPRCSHWPRDGWTLGRCSALAEFHIHAPNGAPVPGGFMCSEHGELVHHEYQQKLGEEWALVPLAGPFRSNT